MKKFIGIKLVCFLLLTTTLKGFSQDDGADGTENYLKTNIAVTKFQILGVTRRQYAKCVETENYADPEKKLKSVVIGKTIFADDGQGYDLKADDGILTSTEVFDYTNSNVAIPGMYKEGVDYNSVLSDEGFAYLSRTSTTSWPGIRCKVKWVPCSEMPEPKRTMCYIAGFPYGDLIFYDCEVHFW